MASWSLEGFLAATSATSSKLETPILRYLIRANFLVGKIEMVQFLHEIQIFGFLVLVLKWNKLILQSHIISSMASLSVSDTRCRDKKGILP